MKKKTLFISRKFDLKGNSAPSRYFLDVIKRFDDLGYDITVVKLDFKSSKIRKSITTDLPYKLVLPGFISISSKLVSLKYLFLFKWKYYFGFKPEIEYYNELPSEREIKFLKGISKSEYDIVFVDYFFLAESLELFSGIKAIITHDVWHQHYSVGKNNSYFGLLTLEEEKRLLNMADLVIAISKRDRLIFENLPLTDAKVIDLYPVIKPRRIINEEFITQKVESNTIIFVGSNYRPNVYGLEWFLDQVWPLLYPRENNVRLKVIGNVKKYIRPEFLDFDDHIEFLGFVEDLSIHYDEAKLAITPLREGSGVKIKSIEAIEYGLPIISTSVGAQGLDHFAGSGIKIEDSPSSFAKSILDLFKDPSCLRYELTSLNNARDTAIENQKDLSELKAILN
ncbi:glycosyltransferase [Psychroflexus salinarum]|uniref:Glycosyltransferase n=1 Tax=Psychroflexus salinarum TaxID=546024 RepID=A0ABW3GRS9_9FLAO